MDVSDSLLEQEVHGQGVFVGRFEHSLDPKKRLTIPSSWRAQMGDTKSLYVMPDLVKDKCLVVLPAAEMQRRMAKIRNQPMSDGQARLFSRFLASQSDLVSWDVQGRIRISDALLERADLIDQVFLVGAFEVFELWSPERFAESADVSQADISELAKHVGF